MQVAFYLVDLLQDANAEVVKAADQALTVISETDEEWAAKLRALKFEAHNQAWLEACASSSTQQVRSTDSTVQMQPYDHWIAKESHVCLCSKYLGSCNKMSISRLLLVMGTSRPSGRMRKMTYTLKTACKHSPLAFVCFDATRAGVLMRHLSMQGQHPKL